MKIIFEKQQVLNTGKLGAVDIISIGLLFLQKKLKVKSKEKI